MSISQEAFTRKTIEEFPEVIDTTAKDPASKTLFKVREPSAKNILLGPEQAQAFHQTVTKLLYLAARAMRHLDSCCIPDDASEGAMPGQLGEVALRPVLPQQEPRAPADAPG